MTFKVPGLSLLFKGGAPRTGVAPVLSPSIGWRQRLTLSLGATRTLPCLFQVPPSAD